jgi:plasmid stabilization system protein ParE
MEVGLNRDVQWSLFALKKLQQVHKFYIKIANNEIADKIVDEIFRSVKTLSHSSFIGQQEPALEKLKKDHRYILSHHCKIIYKIDLNTVYITHVFDSRQNPEKLK